MEVAVGPPSVAVRCPICFVPLLTITATCEPGRAGATDPPHRDRCRRPSPRAPSRRTVGCTASRTGALSAMWNGPFTPFQRARRTSGRRTLSTVLKPPSAAVVATASTTQWPDALRLDAHLLARDRRGERAVDRRRAAERRGLRRRCERERAGTDRQHLAGRRRGLAGEPVTVSVTVYEPAVHRCGSPSRRSRSGHRRSPTRTRRPMSRVASTVIVSGVLPFGTDVVNDALTAAWRLETAWATPTSASRPATTSAAILVRVTALRYAPDARSPSWSPGRRCAPYFMNSAASSASRLFAACTPTPGRIERVRA